MKRLMRPKVLLIAAVCIALAATGASVYAQREGRGGGGGRAGGGGFGGGGRGGFNPSAMVERAMQGSWAFISFELDTTDEQLTTLRKSYAKTWKESRAAFEEAGDDDGAREAMGAVMQNLQGLRDTTKESLTEEQAAKLDEWYANQMQGPGGRGGFGGGGEGGRRFRGGGQGE